MNCLYGNNGLSVMVSCHEQYWFNQAVKMSNQVNWYSLQLLMYFDFCRTK